MVDAHNHLGRWLSRTSDWVVVDVGRLLDTMDRCGIEAIVNLDGRWGDELEANLERYDRAHPGRFATFCHVDWREAAAPGFTKRLIASLEASVTAGARGLKVWKDLGLGIVDDRGELLLADDDRLSDLWERAGELGVPVLIHSGDPVAFWQPIDRFNERLEELLANPEWSFHDDRWPRLGRLLEALENVVEAHPATIFIGAHVIYPENLAWVAARLERYSNLHVDIAARVAELGRQPAAARRLFLEHPERILFGLDLFPPSEQEYAISFRFLETADEHFAYSTEDTPPQGRWNIYGVDLPDAVLQAVYADNARRLIPGLG